MQAVAWVVLFIERKLPPKAAAGASGLGGNFPSNLKTPFVLINTLDGCCHVDVMLN